jgi:cell division protein FtsB
MQWLNIFLMVLLACETVLFAGVAVWGPYGMHAVRTMQTTIQDTKKVINGERSKIAQLQREWSRWQHSSFYQEKIAREQLQLARPGDIIYFLS